MFCPDHTFRKYTAFTSHTKCPSRDLLPDFKYLLAYACLHLSRKPVLVFSYFSSRFWIQHACSYYAEGANTDTNASAAFRSTNAQWETETAFLCWPWNENKEAGSCTVMCSRFWIASLELQSDPAFVTPVLQEMGTWLPASSHPILHLELRKNWISDIALHLILAYP